MIIKMTIDGVIEKTVGDRVFKMSNNVNKIYLIGPIAQTSNVLINFKLPDETMQYGIMTYSGLDVAEGMAMWQYPVRNNITEIPGRVDIAIEVRTTSEVILSAETYLTVESSISSEIVPTDVDEFLTLANDSLFLSNEAKALWQSYIAAGDTNLEVVNARGAYTKLIDRLIALDDKDSNLLLQILQKRDKTTPITQSDLDTSSDSKKIKQINLAQEVLDAIAGTAALMTNVVDGSITKSKIAQIQGNYILNKDSNGIVTSITTPDGTITLNYLGEELQNVQEDYGFGIIKSTLNYANEEVASITKEVI